MESTSNTAQAKNTKTKKKLPQSLKDDLLDSETRLTKVQLELKKSETERSEIDARYDADKLRYKELTGR